MNHSPSWIARFVCAAPSMAMAAIGLSACSTAPERALVDVAPPASTAVQTYGTLPLRFEENHGQTDASVRYLARGPGYGLFLTADEAVLSLKPAEPPASRHSRSGRKIEMAHAPETATLRIALVGARDDPELSAEAPQPGRSNHFIDSDPERWTIDVPGYGRVRYHQVYPGIDLVYYGNPQQLEYDFVVAPGADPAPIRVRYRGADEARIDDDGSLVLAVAGRRIVQRKPIIYQDIDGERVPVEGDYVLEGSVAEDEPLELAFALGDYDPAHALVIDPVLVYSTYVSGGDYDTIRGLAVDDSGYVFVTGMTFSTNFPVVGGLPPGQGGQSNPDTFDIFVAKLHPDGNALVYSTYLAGNGDDFALDLTIDAAGAAYVTGVTSSTNFPVVGGLPPGQAGAPDGTGSPFVAKLNPAGDALVYSTYLAAGHGHDEAFGLAVDGDGNAYVTGFTSPPYLFPTVGGLPPNQGGLPAGDGAIFITKVNPAGNDLIYSTYLAGSGFEWAMDLAVDDLGQVYVGGLSTSFNLPRVGGLSSEQGGNPNGEEAGYFAKLNADGNALVYSTYLAALLPTSGVYAEGVAVDAAGSLYIVGRTGDDFPVVGGLPPEQGGQRGDNCCSDVFIVKLNPAGDALVYSTYLGGNYIDGAYDLVVDAAGSVHLTGQTNSTNLPQVSGLPPDQGGTPFVDDGSWGPFGPPVCAYSAKLNPDGNALDYATYLCGNGMGWVLGLDDGGDAYIAGDAGQPWLYPFPIVGGLPPGQGGAALGGIEAFVAKLTTSAPLVSIERARFEVPSAQDVIDVAVVRSGSLDDLLSVDYTTLDGTALGGLHYTPATGTLFWPPGNGDPQTVSITLNPGASGSGEDDPYFHLQLSNAIGGMIGTPDIAAITIHKEDPIFANGFE